MGLENAEAIILDVFDLHDQDRIVTLLTRERGKVRGVARAARRKYSRFAGQLQPLAKARVVWFESSGRELVRLSSVELVRTAEGCMQDLEGILLAGYIAEHITEFAQENEESDHLFRLLDSTIDALLAGVDADLATRYFEAWVLRLAGIFPPPLECPSCGREVNGSGSVLPPGGEGLLCSECGAEAPGDLRVGVGAIAFLLRITNTSVRKMAKEGVTSKVLREVEEINKRVRRAFLQRELKSYRVMRETLARVEGA
jgi:DNA repair protein RecO (recombination protein O)